jgi:CheY-like chemotaxis protein
MHDADLFFNYVACRTFLGEILKNNDIALAHQSAALAAGMNFYFVKPVSPAKLAQALDVAGPLIAVRR